MDFACNPRGSTAYVDLLDGVQAANTSPTWLLVDAALVDGRKLQALASSLSWEISSALQKSPLEAFGDYAPQLIAMPMDKGVAAAGLRRFMDLHTLAPAFSLIESSSSRLEISRLCAYLAQACIDTDMLVHCRFADTRVLPHLLRTLTKVQHARVAGIVNAWFWMDHLGASRGWRPSSEAFTASEADAGPKLELSNEQFANMLAASEPDLIFLLLLENTPELVPDRSRGDFRNRLVQMLARADSRQLVSPNDRFQFAVLSLSCGEDFHEHPALQATWSAVTQRRATLVDEMKTWEDSLWTKLQDRRTVAVL